MNEFDFYVEPNDDLFCKKLEWPLRVMRRHMIHFLRIHMKVEKLGSEVYSTVAIRLLQLQSFQ